MKVEITIDRQKIAGWRCACSGEGATAAIDQNFNNCSLVIRRASSDGLTVLGGMDGDKNV